MHGHAKDRYDASGIVENQFEPGSRGRVLKNLLRITGRREMDRHEALELMKALAGLANEYGPQHRFTITDVRHMHRTWLGSTYPWAGRYRGVNLGKGDLQFAASRHIPALMDEFDRNCLRKHTPCPPSAIGELAARLAVVHVELVLIHPFRDGNGRTARILAMLMALQAGMPPLEFGGLEGRNRETYFTAVRAGFAREYGPMAEVFKAVVERSLKRYA